MRAVERERTQKRHLIGIDRLYCAAERQVPCHFPALSTNRNDSHDGSSLEPSSWHSHQSRGWRQLEIEESEKISSQGKVSAQICSYVPEQSSTVVVVPARSDLSIEEVNATWISQNERTDSAKDVAETVQLLRDINIYDEQGYRVGSMVSYDRTK